MSQTIRFPDIAKPVYPLTEEWEDVGLISEFEDGSQISRPRFTRSRGKWVLTWNALPDADYQKLIQFWRDTAKGKSMAFDWTHPVTGGEPYKVRFAEKQSFKNVAPGLWSGEVTLCEI